VFCIVFFSFKTNFFFAKNRDGLEGVQRRGPVKGAALPRSSQTLDREHRWNNAVCERRGLSGEKMRGKKISAKNTETEGLGIVVKILSLERQREETRRNGEAEGGWQAR
jgi:hypothetical protein